MKATVNVIVVSVMLIMLAATGTSASGVLGDDAMRTVRGGCPRDWYLHGQTCGITISCTDNFWNLCVPIIDECRSNAYDQEYKDDWCHYHQGVGGYRGVVRRNCAWRHTCSCVKDPGISLIFHCIKHNTTHDQAQYDQCVR